MDTDTPTLSVAETVPADPGPSDLHPRVSYFGVSTTYDVSIGNDGSYVRVKKMLEGDRRKYQNAINKGVTIAQQTGDAKIELAPGDQRYFLLKNAIVGWDLVENGQPVQFNDAAKEMLLQRGLVDPNTGKDYLDDVEHQVRLHNPWLLDDVTVDKLNEQIERLTEVRDAKVAEEGKEQSSAS